MICEFRILTLTPNIYLAKSHAPNWLLYYLITVIRGPTEYPYPCRRLSSMATFNVENILYAPKRVKGYQFSRFSNDMLLMLKRFHRFAIRIIPWFQSKFSFNTQRPRQNGRHLPDDIFKWIFLNENVWISINMSLMFVSRGPINNIPILVQVMAWRRPGDKPLSEPMMFRLPTHLCVTRSQWIKRSDTRSHCAIRGRGRWSRSPFKVISEDSISPVSGQGENT